MVRKTGALTGTSAATGIVLSLADVAPSDKPQTATIHLALEGGKAVRAAAAPGPWGQSWHEVDARGLATLSADRIEGDLVLVLNRDKWQFRRTACPGIAGRVHVAAQRQGNSLVGTWRAVWGEAYSFTGDVRGVRRNGPSPQ